MTFLKQSQSGLNLVTNQMFSLFFTSKACKTFEETMLFALAAIHDINQPNDWHEISSFGIDPSAVELIKPSVFQSGKAAYAILCDDDGNIDCKPLTYQITI